MEWPAAACQLENRVLELDFKSVRSIIRIKVKLFTNSETLLNKNLQYTISLIDYLRYLQVLNVLKIFARLERPVFNVIPLHRTVKLSSL